MDMYPGWPGFYQRNVPFSSVNVPCGFVDLKPKLESLVPIY